MEIKIRITNNEHFWFVEVILKEEISEESAMNSFELNTDTSLPLPTIHEDDESFAEYQISVFTTGQEDSHQQSHITATVGSRGNYSGTENAVADLVPDSTDAHLSKYKDTTGASFDKDENYDTKFYTVPNVGSRDQGKDDEICTILYGPKKYTVKHKSFDEDFVTRKELSTVHTCAEDDQGTVREKCRISASEERVICSSEDLSKTHADVEAEVVKDENFNELKTANQARQIAQPASSLLEPAEEFQVRSI